MRDSLMDLNIPSVMPLLSYSRTWYFDYMLRKFQKIINFHNETVYNIIILSPNIQNSILQVLYLPTKKWHLTFFSPEWPHLQECQSKNTDKQSFICYKLEKIGESASIKIWSAYGTYSSKSFSNTVSYGGLGSSMSFKDINSCSLIDSYKIQIS